MNTVRVAKAAARRAAAGELLKGAGWALFAGAGVGVLLVGADKAAGGLVAWPWLIGVPLAAAALAAAGVAIARWWSVARAARELDHRLALSDKLSTGLSLAGQRDAFAEWAVREAERAAGAVNVPAAMPIRAPWTWGVWPVLTAGAIVLALFAPVVRWERKNERTGVSENNRAAATEQVRQVAAAVKAGVQEPRAREASADQLRLLDEIDKELASGQVQPKEAGARAASVMEEIAHRMESQARSQELAADRTREELARAARDAQTEGRNSSLSDALKKGDLETASQAAAELTRVAKDLSPQEREQVARELEDLSRALDTQAEAATSAEQRPDKRDGSKPEASGAAAATGKTGAAAQNPPEPRTPETQPDADQPETQRAREAEKRQEEQHAREEAQRNRESLKQALQNAAREVREKPDQSEPPQSEPGRETGRENQGQPGTTGQTGDQGSPPPDQHGSPPQSDGQRQQQPGQQGATGQTRSQPHTQPEGEKQGQTGQTGEQGQPAPTGERQGTGQQPSASPGQQQNDGGQQQPNGRVSGEGERRSAAQEEQREGAQGAKGETGAPGQTGGTGQEPGEQPGAHQDQSRGAQKGGEGDHGKRPGGEGEPQNAPDRGLPQSAVQRLAKELKQLAQGQKPPTREQAQRAREIAQKMMHDATPERRRELERLAREFAKANPDQGRYPDGNDATTPGTTPGVHAQRSSSPAWTGATAPVDARRAAKPGDQPKERTLAEWYGDGKTERAVQTSGGVADAMREAAQGAERAVEQQQVPARYSDLVRRVFRRYADGAAEKK